MKELSKKEYIDELKYCYKNSRWEFSYYSVLYLYLSQYRNEKIQLVHCADWKSRGKRTSAAMKKVLEFCSAKFKDKNGKEYTGGIPDFQFVPSRYSFDNPCHANVFIEFKAPQFSDDGIYIPKKYKETTEIKHEFLNCDKIIYTDGISWFFLIKNQDPTLDEPINLMDTNDNWDTLKNKIIEFIN